MSDYLKEQDRIFDELARKRADLRARESEAIEKAVAALLAIGFTEAEAREKLREKAKWTAD